MCLTLPDGVGEGEDAELKWEATSRRPGEPMPRLLSTLLREYELSQIADKTGGAAMSVVDSAPIMKSAKVNRVEMTDEKRKLLEELARFGV